MDSINEANTDLKHPDYHLLPECVKSAFSEREYAAMPHQERNSLIEDITMPDYEEE